MPRILHYLRPETRQEAAELLELPDSSPVPLLISPRPVPLVDLDADFVLDLSRLGLDFINQDETGRVHLGGLVSLAAIQAAALVSRSSGGLLNQAAGWAATPVIRNVSSLWGAVVSSRCCQEFVLAMLVLDAELTWLNAGSGRRVCGFAECVSAGRDSRPAGILEEARFVPLSPGNTGWSLERISRTPRDEPILAAVALVQVQAGRASRVALALAGADPAPMRLPAVEEFLLAKSFSDNEILDAADLAVTQCQPSGDFRAGGEYRRSMVRVLVGRALYTAWARATDQTSPTPQV